MTATEFIPDGMVGPVFTLLVTGLPKKSLHLCPSSNLGQNTAQYMVCSPTGQWHQSSIATNPDTSHRAAVWSRLGSQQRICTLHHLTVIFLLETLCVHSKVLGQGQRDDTCSVLLEGISLHFKPLLYIRCHHIRSPKYRRKPNAITL